MATIPEALELAVRHHQAGELAQAEKIYRQILTLDRQHADALHLLGVIESGVGNYAKATDLISRAIAVNPQAAAYHSNLGNALKDQGKFDEAVASYERAVQIKPDFAQAHYNLGVALTELGRLDDAVASNRRALQIEPSYAQAYYNLGNALNEQEKFDEAVKAYECAMQIDPDYADAANNLGSALTQQGKLDEAIASYHQVIRIKPDHVQAYLNLANALKNQGKLEEAVAFYQRVIRIKPDYAEAHSSLGETFKEQGDLDKAVGSYERALQIKPESTEVHYNLGIAFKEQGKLDEAVSSYQNALQIKPDYSLAHFSLSQIKKFSGDDLRIRQMESLLDDDSRLDKDRVLLNFALGTAYDELGDYDLAFHHFAEGNQLKRQMFEYDPAARVGYVSALIEFFNPKSFAELGDSMAVNSEMPIFIVGMPRSGTTLAEQILASHPDVYGAGELKHVSALIPRLLSLSTKSKDFPQCLKTLPTGIVRELAGEYIEQLRQLSPETKHVSDKMPGNFFSLGLIALLWPNSKIIHCRRNPVAVGFSCYRRYFWDSQLFAWDLAEIGHYWRQYDRLWHHWQQVLTIPVFELQYEQLVERSENEIRLMLDHCGLPWDDRCLDSHRTRRVVQTTPEVRQPIYREAVEHWQHYRHHLESLTQAIAGELEPSN
jgi:tetratricopeptide (TPR) repeat protein